MGKFFVPYNGRKVNDMIRGINVSNPVVFDRDYLFFVADYAIKNGIDHVQFNGPIHDPVKGNIDGMVFYKKYAQFNTEKDREYVNYALSVGNEVTEKLSFAGVKCYMWHHELELPLGFEREFPEILNEDLDVEVTHPRVKDFLLNKISDFFDAYPYMNGIVLTLHETRIPLLKLKNQKLSPTDRVKYVTEILYEACKSAGRELIVRPFASTSEDYTMMANAYEQISNELVIMDKWTQFDWSLTLPSNQFFSKIKNNPLLVEADIFGEFFGKGLLPLMLERHIEEKIAYCKEHSPIGYCARIDREGYDAFGTVNEINLALMLAHLSGKDPQEAKREFFSNRYGDAADTVLALMTETEEIQKKIFYANGYYFTELSRFPRVNHSKNHFYFEMMRRDYRIASGEWFIPHDWDRISPEFILEEKREARRLAEEKLVLLEGLKDVISDEDHRDITVKFKNLSYVCRLWEKLTEVFIAYAAYFDDKRPEHEKELNEALVALECIDAEAREELGDDFYLTALGKHHFDAGDSEVKDGVLTFIDEIRENFEIERRVTERLDNEGLTDYVIPGAAMEGHALMKEVNFSYTFADRYGISRTPGKHSGKAFSGVNAHGWFSYELRCRVGEDNTVKVKVGAEDGNIDFYLSAFGKRIAVKDKSETPKEFTFTFPWSADARDKVRIRIDRMSASTPFVYEIKVL